jgi:hypothetical protein
MSDEVNDIAGDRLGNIYVVGNFAITENKPGSFLSSYLTPALRKYTGKGDLVWERKGDRSAGYGGKEAVTTDGVGNVFMVGHVGFTLNSRIERRVRRHWKHICGATCPT